LLQASASPRVPYVLPIANKMLSELFIVECNRSIKLKTTHFQTLVYGLFLFCGEELPFEVCPSILNKPFII
jgi:hypothetical protein